MQYSKFTYLWPPRPEVKAPPAHIAVYEKRGFIGQVKKNGTCTIVAVSPEGKITMMNRHNENHKAWKSLPEKAFPELTKLRGGWYYFIGELLHSKVEGIRDTLYLFDILVDDGEYLVGETQAERTERLRTIFLKGNEETTYSHYIISPKLWVARDHTSGLTKLYEGLNAAEDEGIVMKSPKERLQLASRQKSNISGQVKCRKLHKNFSF